MKFYTGVYYCWTKLLLSILIYYNAHFRKKESKGIRGKERNKEKERKREKNNELKKGKHE
jgi:hypothetical protein